MNTHDTRRPSGLVNTLVALLAGLLKMGLAIVGFVAMLGVMLLGFTLGLGVLLWARLTGRRPNVAFTTRWPGGRMNHPFRPRGNTSAARGMRHGEVIDVEVRDVSRSGPAARPGDQVDPQAPLR